MKKFLIISIAVISLLSLAGCNNGPARETDEDSTKKPSNTATATPKPTEAPADGMKKCEKDTYSFSYPEKWSLTDTENAVTVADMISATSLNITTAASAPQIMTLPLETLEETYSSIFEAMFGELKDFKVENSKFNGKDCIKMTFGVAMGNIKQDVESYIINTDKNMFSINYTVLSDNSDKAEFVAEKDKILSSIVVK